METTRIVLVDDHRVVRESLAKALAQEKDFNVAGSWSRAEEAIAFLESSSFDVAILDYALPGMDGISATRLILEARPEVRVIILSMHCREQVILEAFDVGVSAFLPKEVSVDELAEAVRAVHSGESVLSPKITRRLLEFCQRIRDGEETRSPLTPTQIEALRLAASGYANKEIADRMGLPVNTVKLRLKEVFTRLNARDRTHAVITALRLGLFGLDDPEE